MSGTMATTTRYVNPATSNKHYEEDENRFLSEVQKFQKATGRKFLAFSDYLIVLKNAGLARAS